MTSFLFDTCIVIDLLRGKQAAKAFYRDLIETLGEDSDRALVVSVVTVHEIHQGMRSDERERTDALMREFHVLPVDETVARLSGSMCRRFRRSHNLDSMDAIIAATAQVAGAELVTCNLKHFPMFPDLRRPY